MEQPNLASSVTTQSDLSAIGSNNRPPMLRRVSQSEPHLDIPHFSTAQEKGFHINSVLSNLFEKQFHASRPLGASSEVFDSPGEELLKKSTMSASTDHLSVEPEALRKHSLDRNKSALELSAIDSSQQGGDLRKVASVANYNLFRRESAPADNFSFVNKLQLHPPGIGSSASHHHISTIPEDEGIMMTATRAGSAGDSLASSSSARQLGIDASSSTGTSPQKSTFGSGLMGVFSHGFFAKPVMRSKEENYRYIMALDR